MSDMATDVTPETTTETTPETSTQEPSGFAIPEDYKESGWAKGIESNESLWKKLAGSQKLIGDRGAFIPQEGASGEEVEAFLSRLDPFSEQLKGKFAPTAPEAYEFSELPEGINVDSSITDKFSEIAKAQGLSNEQADSVRKEWINHEVEMQASRNEALNTEFEQMAKDMWGDSWVDVTAEASELLKNNVPEEMRQAMVDMPNQYLVPLVATLKGMKGTPDGKPNVSGAHSMSPEEARAKYTELRKAAQLDPRKQQAFNDFNEANRNLINRN